MRWLYLGFCCLVASVHATDVQVEQAVVVLEVKTSQLSLQQAELQWGQAQAADAGMQGWYVESGVGSGLQVAVEAGKFLGIGKGGLPLQDRLTLRVNARLIPVEPLSLQAGPAEATLEFVDDGGQVWLVAEGFHHYFKPGSRQFTLDAMSIFAGPALLQRVSMSGKARWYLGRAIIQGLLAEPWPVLRGTVACGNPRWHDGINYLTDVALIDIPNVEQVELGNPWVTVAPSAELRNVGTADVPWFRKFATPTTDAYPPPYTRDQHPLLTWNMYRIDGAGLLRQIGRAAVKHAFNAVNYDCSCYGGGSSYDPWNAANPTGFYGSILWSATHPDNAAGVGCRDIYWAGTNDYGGFLGTREEVPAYSMAWEQCGSLFAPDASPGDVPCNQISFTEYAPQPGERRMVLDTTELTDASSRYLVEAWYLIRDDINIFNTMGHVDVVPALQGSIWQFPESNFTQGSILDAWVDPASPGMAASSHTYDNGQGHAGMAVRVLDMGGGVYRYVMALANHDFDPAISSVNLTLEPGFTVLGGGFHDADNDPANDWSFSQSGDVLNWQAPADGSNPQRWGNLYVYWYEVAGAAPLPWRPQGVAQASPASATDTPFSFNVLVPAQRIFDGGFE